MPEFCRDVHNIFSRLRSHVAEIELSVPRGMHQGEWSHGREKGFVRAVDSARLTADEERKHKHVKAQASAGLDQ